MLRNLMLGVLFVAVLSNGNLLADVVTDWNTTLNDAIVATPTKHNPGTSTRGIAMLNAAIYDVFQNINRTHAPFKVNQLTPGASLEAAVAQAAYRTIVDCYGEQQSVLDGVLAARLAAIPDSAAKTAGIDLGNYIGQHYVDAHANDGHEAPDIYTETGGPGRWTSDPLNPGQKGWGQHWGSVPPWVMSSNDQFSVAAIPAISSPEYAAAFNQVKEYGAINSASRTADQTAIGLFWAYDRPNLPGKPGNGPPPVLFIENLIDIAAQAGNTPAENARLFALASVSMADAAIAAWDVKFDTDFWRPITAIRADAANDDDNPLTAEDLNWVPLGAPGFDPNSSSDDFTPPFPAYTSGHATMGGAVFKSLELFYGTNVWDDVDGIPGNNPVFELNSNEPGGGGTRTFDKFTQSVPLTVGTEDSPEGENAISRVYLGIHWLFDGTEGIKLGNSIANYAYSSHFQLVPEPSTLAMIMLGTLAHGITGRRRPTI